MFYLSKQPREETTFAVDLAGFREVQQGEKIKTVEVLCTLGGEEAEDIVVSSSHTDSVVKVRVAGGDDGKKYLIEILATTDGGHVRETDVLLEVRERP